MIALYSASAYTYIVTDHVMPEQDPHRTLTKVGENCYRFISKEDCASHGHMSPPPLLESLKKMSCFGPSMISDYC